MAWTNRHDPTHHRLIAWKMPCRAATTANITIATALNNADSLDGVTLATGDRVLVKNQTAAEENGIYIVDATPVRAHDFADGTEAVGAVAFISEGTVNGNKTYICTTNAPITLDTTTLVFAEFGAGGGVNIAASNTTYTSGTVIFSGGANVTVGTNGQTVTFSAGGGAGQFSAGMSTMGNTAGNTGVTGTRYVLVGTGALSLSQTTDANGGTLSMSVPAQTVQTQNMVAISASNALFSSGTVVMSGFGDVTVNTAAGTIRISAPVQTVQTQNLVAISASDALFSSGTVVLSGLGAATVNTAAGSIRISVPVQTAATGISGIQNSQTTYTSGTVDLVGLANITIRSTTGQKFEFSVAAGGAGGGATMSRWDNFGVQTGAGSLALSASTRSLFVFPLNPAGPFPGEMTVSTARILINQSGSTVSITNQKTIGYALGIYRISASNAQSTLSLVNSAMFSTTQTTLGSANAVQSLHGTRWVEWTSNHWSSAPAFSGGVEYAAALFFSWSSVTFQTFGIHGGSNLSTFNASGPLGAATATGTSRGFSPYGGIYTVTTNGMPASIHISQLNKQAANANFIPFIEFDNLVSSR